MIYTLTLNPALDLELSVAEILFNQVVRASQVRVDCGGKGFNISRALAKLGTPSVALGLVGGKTGERLAEELEKQGVKVEFTWISAETRTNVAIVTTPLTNYIKVNQPGPTITSHEMASLLEKVQSLVGPGDLWALSGSLPPGAASDAYQPLISAIQSSGGKALIDADGDTLHQACREKPYLVKPNAIEASQLAGIQIHSPADARQAAGLFHAMGVIVVMVTLAEQGAVISDGKNAWWARPPQVTVQSPIGAGDAALAGYIWGMVQGNGLPDALRMAVASGSASASLPGTAVADMDLIGSIADKVEVISL